MTKSGTRDCNQALFLFLGNILFDIILFSSNLSIFDRCQSSYNPDIRILLSTPFLYFFYMKGGKHAVTQDDDCLMNCLRELFI